MQELIATLDFLFLKCSHSQSNKSCGMLIKMKHKEIPCVTSLQKVCRLSCFPMPHLATQTQKKDAYIICLFRKFFFFNEHCILILFKKLLTHKHRTQLELTVILAAYFVLVSGW